MTPPPAGSQAAAHSMAGLFQSMRHATGLFPRSRATGARRSQRTPNFFRNGPDASQRLPRRAAPTLTALRRRKVLQPGFTSTAIHAPLSLSSIPKASASFTNFQMYAQFHDLVSISAIPPRDSACVLLVPGVRAVLGYSGFCRPVGGLPSALSGCLSCSQAVQEILRRGQDRARPTLPAGRVDCDAVTSVRSFLNRCSAQIVEFFNWHPVAPLPYAAGLHGKTE